MKLIQYIPPTPAKVAIVGEAPGGDEDASGIPFIGAEGQYYQKKILKPAGIQYQARSFYNRRTKSRDVSVSGDVYVTNVAHHKPIKNKFETLSKDQKAFGVQQLKTDLTKWKEDGLNVAIAVGAHALEALTGKTGITSLRGSVMESTLVPGLKVVATIHPGNLFRGNHKMEPIIIMDHQYALEEAKTPEFTPPERNVRIISERWEAIRELQAITDVNEVVVADIETNLKTMLTAFGVATSPSEAFVLTKEVLKYPDVIRALGEFCVSKTPILYHNVLFDVFFLAFYYQIVNRNFGCTMLAQHANFPTLPKSLAFCASIYTHEPYWKDEGKEAFESLKKGGYVDWEKLYLYCGKDCCLTYEIHQSQQEEMEEWGTKKIYDLMLSLVDPCLCAMLKGITIDVTADRAYAKKNERSIEILEKMVKETVSPDVNIKSHQQLKDLLYEKWDLPKQYKQGKLSSDAKKLKKLETFPTPYKLKIGLIRATKERYNERQFYDMELESDGKVRTALKPHGTYTGRFASSKSITGSGRNYQNVPEPLRKAFVPEPGKIFMNRDLSQAEARVVAALCRDLQWLKDFDETDQHSKVATMIFDIPFEKVDKKLHRKPAKKVAHASHYKIGPGLLSEDLGCSMSEARDFKERYFNFRYTLNNWHTEVEKMLRGPRFIRTAFGRVIQFFGPITDALIREAVAAEPQSTSADYLNTGIVAFHENLPKEYEFLLQVHDSILSQQQDDLGLIKEIYHMQTELMHKEITIRGIKFSIPLDGEIGYSWGDMVEVKDDFKSAREEAKEKFAKSQEENLKLLKAS